jgi:hypothetical protein
LLYLTVPVNVEFEANFKFNAANCALDTGLLASLVLSTFAKLISTLSNTTTPTLPLTLSTAFELYQYQLLPVYKILKLLKHQHKLFDLDYAMQISTVH